MWKFMRNFPILLNNQNPKSRFLGTEPEPDGKMPVPVPVLWLEPEPVNRFHLTTLLACSMYMFREVYTM